MCAFGFFDFDQDNVISDLTDRFPGNDKGAFSSEQTAEFSRTWNDQSFNLTGFAVKFNIDGTSEAFAGADIDDFLCFQFTKTHKITAFSAL